MVAAKFAKLHKLFNDFLVVGQPLNIFLQWNTFPVQTLLQDTISGSFIYLPFPRDLFLYLPIISNPFDLFQLGQFASFQSLTVTLLSGQRQAMQGESRLLPWVGQPPGTVPIVPPAHFTSLQHSENHMRPHRKFRMFALVKK